MKPNNYQLNIGSNKTDEEYFHFKNDFRYVKCPDECRYYGSDLNKFIRECCRWDMGVMNIDCLQHDRNIKVIRFIEYKRKNEALTDSQEELIALLSDILKKNIFSGYKIYFYIITGNFPFDSVTVINRVMEKKKDFFTQDEFKEFLNLKYEIE